MSSTPSPNQIRTCQPSDRLAGSNSLCCVLGQDTLLSQCLSPPRSINGYEQTVRETCQNVVGGLPVTD